MNPERPRCKALTKDGKACGAAPTSTGLCFFHGNPNKASELGRIGGKRNRRNNENIANPALKLDDAASVSERLESLFHALETGSARPAVATVQLKVIDLLFRVREKTVIENQIQELGEQLRSVKSLITMRHSG
jgi:hypothetical protein